MERDADRVLQLFITAVDAAGGLGSMVAERRLTWLPMLMESACTLVMQEEEHRDPGEIADLLGTTRDAVENMLAGPADTAPQQVRDLPPGELVAREYIAGGVVRHAYQSRGAAPTA